MTNTGRRNDDFMDAQGAPAGSPGAGGRAHTYGMGKGSRPAAAPRYGMGEPHGARAQSGTGAPGAPAPGGHGGVPAGGMPSTASAAPAGPRGGGPTQQPPQRRKRPVGFWIAIVVALLAVAAACFFAFRACDSGLGLRDPNQAAGQLEGKTPEEMQAELDRIVEEGMFNISIASVVEFQDGASEGELRIENVPGNHYLMQVTVTRDDTGDVVYETGIIEPNHHIQRARLSTDLPAGTYPCTAVFTALDPETEEEVGKAAATITVNVLG